MRSRFSVGSCWGPCRSLSRLGDRCSQWGGRRAPGAGEPGHAHIRADNGLTHKFSPSTTRSRLRLAVQRCRPRSHWPDRAATPIPARTVITSSENTNFSPTKSFTISFRITLKAAADGLGKPFSLVSTTSLSVRRRFTSEIRHLHWRGDLPRSDALQQPAPDRRRSGSQSPSACESNSETDCGSTATAKPTPTDSPTPTPSDSPTPTHVRQLYAHTDDAEYERRCGYDHFVRRGRWDAAGGFNRKPGKHRSSDRGDVPRWFDPSCIRSGAGRVAETPEKAFLTELMPNPATR